MFFFDRFDDNAVRERVAESIMVVSKATKVNF